MKPQALAVVAVAVAVASLLAWSARATDRNFAGSVQLDYFGVPTKGANLNAGEQATQYGFDGLTLEAAGKVAVDVSDHVSANLKVCFGCHGFELDMAYVDYRVADELNIRIGRFSPSFGAFNLRHDVANHKLSDKPLPYDMGRMLRLRTWNLGVLPSPFPDNGIEVNGTHWMGDSTQLDYAVYAVQGFRSDDPHPLDLDFARSREIYYTDNNGIPTGGARLALTQKLGTMSDFTLGASGMAGPYDPNNSLYYAILGGDLSVRIYRTNIRMEYLVRRTQFDTSVPSRLALTGYSDYFVKHGAYLEIEQPLSSRTDLLVRADGMYRAGNVVADPSGNTFLGPRSFVTRYTLGTAYAFDRAFRVKLSTEVWQFSDADDDGHYVDVGVHVAFVGTF